MVLVKSTPELRERQLVTEEQARAIDARWQTYHARNEQARTVRKFGGDSRPLSEIAVDPSNHDHGRMANHNLALTAAKSGQPFLDLLRRAKRHDLLALTTWSGTVDIPKVRIGAGRKPSCPACAAHADRVYSLADALRDDPLPCSGCTCTMLDSAPGFCTCMYLAEFDD